jgi:hypothetical protein
MCAIYGFIETIEKTEECGSQPAWSQIFEIETKVKALSWLLESQDPDCPHRLPDEMQDVNAGLGLLFLEIGEQLAEVRRHLEGIEIKNAKKDRQ